MPDERVIVAVPEGQEERFWIVRRWPGVAHGKPYGPTRRLRESVTIDYPDGEQPTMECGECHGRGWVFRPVGNGPRTGTCLSCDGPGRVPIPPGREVVFARRSHYHYAPPLRGDECTRAECPDWLEPGPSSVPIGVEGVLVESVRVDVTQDVGYRLSVKHLWRCTFTGLREGT